MSTACPTRVTFRTALLTVGAAALTLSGAAPAAAERTGPVDPEYSGSVVVTPAKVRAGGQVALRVDSCDGDKALARSRAFVATVTLTQTADETLSGHAGVRAAAEPGRYGITVDCYDKTGNLKRGIAEGSVFVVGGRPHPEPTHHDGGHDGHRDGHHERPVAPVRAGGGGTAGEDDDASASVALGLAGAGAVGLAGFAVVRRRLVARRDADG
ncbi:hypothetical protein [Streptomyces chumphonensis]|uniref:hypothetical protein n=1 Tax=Streptomyces chumphonensis TaxID=1214925 RepID=UPI003D71001C